MTLVHRLTPLPVRGRTPLRPGAQTRVPTVARGLSILECLARSEGGLTLADKGLPRIAAEITGRVGDRWPHPR
jgi:hypothetical protein